MSATAIDEEPVSVTVGDVSLDGDLGVPPDARGVVVIAHGSWSNRHNPPNRFVAGELRRAGLATLLVDLLTGAEEPAAGGGRSLRFDTGLSAARLAAATDWLAADPRTAGLAVGYFGASTGGAAALAAAAGRRNRVAAVVSQGGRLDLAADALPRVRAPTLLVVGGDDEPVIEMNQWAFARLGTPAKELVVVPGASHRFAEPGALGEVGRRAAEWFTRYLAPLATARPGATAEVFTGSDSRYGDW